MPYKTMRDQSDRYNTLRPPAPTPEDEICRCPGTPPVKLMQALSYNPVHCMDCNLEVLPETLGLDDKLARAIAHWARIYDAIDHLWLDSSEYETWAAKQLSEISNTLNCEGREVQRRINDIRRCYYWYFQDQSADDYHPLDDCPSCKQPLVAYDEGIFPQRVCEVCSIVIPA